MAESPESFHAYARFFPPIVAKCRRLLGTTAAAEDVAQETFLRLWTSKLLEESGEERDARTVMAWLYRTCTRLAIDELRRRRGDGAKGDVPTLPCGIDLATLVEARRTIAALATISAPEELEAAILCRVDGLSQPEAASVLGTSERTVRRLLERFDDAAGPLHSEMSS